MEGIYRKKGGAKEPERKRIISGLGHLSMGEEELLLYRLTLLPMEDGEGPRDNYLTVLDQKIPYRLIKIMFLGVVVTAVRSDIKSRFGIMGF